MTLLDSESPAAISAEFAESLPGLLALLERALLNATICSRSNKPALSS